MAIFIDRFHEGVKRKEYIFGRGPETLYYILTFKISISNYKVIILQNHSLIVEEYEEGLTAAKHSAFEALLKLDPDAFNRKEVTMVHYKHDRPNGKPWVKDTENELNKNLNKFLLGVTNKDDDSKLNTANKYIQQFKQEESKDVENIQLNQTERDQLIKARIGQTSFKTALVVMQKKCSLCGVSDIRFLIASHIKPWSKSTDAERMDINNGLLLCPNHDFLFDKGYITFSEGGFIILSSELSEETKLFFNVNKDIGLSLNTDQKEYMKWHKENVFINS
ncbi:HNH endonuclease [Metabacillus sp. 84]|uniref:HNH endonuclease n=1 Tax=Metabacillus sp. 84 TaxID=3404705 RepID=UPI003CEC5631